LTSSAIVKLPVVDGAHTHAKSFPAQIYAVVESTVIKKVIREDEYAEDSDDSS
jgi:hypothetical protein